MDNLIFEKLREIEVTGKKNHRFIVSKNFCKKGLYVKMTKKGGNKFVLDHVNQKLLS